MKRYLLLFAALCMGMAGYAQKKNFSYKFYGQVRGDLFYNSRANAEIVDGLFHLYPKDKNLDAEGNDLNATANGSFYLLYSRLGVDVTGPNIGKAVTTAKLEADFRGSGSNWAVLRIRHAYVNLDWGKSAVLVGITWHPLFGAVMPDVLNLSTGAPFQPFNRSPQIRYQYKANSRVQLMASVLWQLQYLSSGPKGMSEDYIKNSCIPEMFVGADFTPADGWLMGLGAHMISLKPRTSTEWKEQTFKVNERMTAFSYEAHLKYSGRNYTFAAKTLMASALDHTALLGGYGVSSVDSRTGEQGYTPFRHSTTWVNFAYGTKWRPGVFVGYTKNLGTGKSLVSADKVYGMGLDIDQLITVSLNVSYNLPHWKFGFEYCPATAYYGTTDLESGRIEQTHAITNHRILGLMMYYF
mgnify:FL=1